MMLQASLAVVPDRELAGFTLPESCVCTGVNVNAGHSPPLYLGSDYGKSCSAWESDNGRDCKANWPMCTPGKWCCMSWCYVDHTCPNAIPDDVVPGLFYAYEACTSDTLKVDSCPWRGTGFCPQRDVKLSAQLLGSEISGTKEAEMTGGVAFFTDLHSRVAVRSRHPVHGCFFAPIALLSATPQILVRNTPRGIPTLRPSKPSWILRTSRPSKPHRIPPSLCWRRSSA